MGAKKAVPIRLITEFSLKQEVVRPLLFKPLRDTE